MRLGRLTLVVVAGALATAAFASPASAESFGASGILAPQFNATQKNPTAKTSAVRGRTAARAAYGCSFFRKTIYGLRCDVPDGRGVVGLQIRYNYQPGANRVVATGGWAGVWLDGTNDYSGRTWRTLGSTSDRRAFYLFRACGHRWPGGYACTGWFN